MVGCLSPSTAAENQIVNQLLSGVVAVSANTGGYCLARQGLPAQMVPEPARQTEILMNRYTPQEYSSDHSVEFSEPTSSRLSKNGDGRQAHLDFVSSEWSGSRCSCIIKAGFRIFTDRPISAKFPVRSQHV